MACRVWLRPLPHYACLYLQASSSHILIPPCHRTFSSSYIQKLPISSAKAVARIEELDKLGCLRTTNQEIEFHHMKIARRQWIEDKRNAGATEHIDTRRLKGKSSGARVLRGERSSPVPNLRSRYLFSAAELDLPIVCVSCRGTSRSPCTRATESLPVELQYAKLISPDPYTGVRFRLCGSIHGRGCNGALYYGKIEQDDLGIILPDSVGVWSRATFVKYAKTGILVQRINSEKKRRNSIS